MRFSATILLLLAPIFSAGQTTYTYDKHWQQTTKPKSVAFRREVTPLGNNVYQVTDYYNNRQRLMEGKYVTLFSEYLGDYRSTLFRNDTFKYYHENGKLKEVLFFQEGKKIGVSKAYYNTGALEEEGLFVNGYRNGTWKKFHENGKISEEYGYVDNQLHGKWTAYDNKGKLLREETYDMGKSIETWYADTLKPHKYIDEMPEPKYNVSAFLARNIRYPENAKNKGETGKVKVNFVIDTEGYIVDVEPVNFNVDQALQLEAIRVVSLMKRWKPGMKNKIPVRVYYPLPINFRLN